MQLIDPSGAVVATRQVSASVPSVSLTTPNGGDIARTTHRVGWQADDADGDPLTAVVQFSPDAGVTWQTVAIDVTGPYADIDFSQLPGTTEGLLRVRVSDGFHTAEDNSDGLLRLGNSPPRLRVRGPRRANGIAAVWLDAFTSDHEDGPNRVPIVTWASNLQGVLGTGTALSFAPSALWPGLHVITATAVDAAGLTATQSFEFLVALDALTPPPAARPSYLAEGATSSFFDTRFALLNPGDRRDGPRRIPAGVWRPDYARCQYPREGASPSTSQPARAGQAEFSTTVEGERAWSSIAR